MFTLCRPTDRPTTWVSVIVELPRGLCEHEATAIKSTCGSDDMPLATSSWVCVPSVPLEGTPTLPTPSDAPTDRPRQVWVVYVRIATNVRHVLHVGESWLRTAGQTVICSIAKLSSSSYWDRYRVSQIYDVCRSFKTLLAIIIR